MKRGSPHGLRLLLALTPFLVYVVAVTVFAMPDGQRSSWTGLTLGLIGMTGSLLQLTVHRPTTPPAMWRIARTTLWLVPLAFIVVVVAVPFVNGSIASAPTRRSALYPGGGLQLLTAGTLAFVWWMRETRRHNATESAGRG